MVKRALRYLPALSLVGLVIAGLRRGRSVKATHCAQSLRADFRRRNVRKRFRRGPAVSRHLRFERRSPRRRVHLRH